MLELANVYTIHSWAIRGAIMGFADVGWVSTMHGWVSLFWCFADHFGTLDRHLNDLGTPRSDKEDTWGHRYRSRRIYAGFGGLWWDLFLLILSELCSLWVAKMSIEPGAYFLRCSRYPGHCQNGVGHCKSGVLLRLNTHFLKSQLVIQESLFGVI